MDVTLRWPTRVRAAVVTAVASALLITVLPGSPALPEAAAADSGCERVAVLAALDDPGTQVRFAAEQAILGDDAAVCAFLATGWDAAREIDARVSVNNLIATAGPSLRGAAETALAATDTEQVYSFLQTGWQTPSDIDLRVRVNQMMASATPRLKVAAQAVLDDGTPEKLETFLQTGWKVSAAIDQRVQVNQIMAAGGPEVKLIAQRALDADDDGDTEALTRFLGSEWEVASARDRESATIGDLTTAAFNAGKVAAQRTRTAVDQANQAVDAAAAAAASAQAAERAAQNAHGDAKIAAAAAKLAVTAAKQAASAARRAVSAAQEARASAQAAADAAARAASAAARAGQEAAAANEAAALAAGDASKAADARKGAENARKAAAAAPQLQAAVDFALTAGDLANAAANFANGAGRHATDAAGSADRAGDYAQAAGANASEAHAAANDARAQANRATNAAQEATAMAVVARDAANTAQAAATLAVADAKEAAAAADDAADHAGDAATAAARSTKAANAATAAAARAVAAMATAQKVYDNARKADASRLALMLAQGQEAAARTSEIALKLEDQAAWDAAESSRRTAETNRLIAEAASADTDRARALRDARTVALTLRRSSGSWTKQAATGALVGGEDELLEYVRTGITFAAAQDDRATVLALSLGDQNPKLAAAATTALDGDDTVVATFLHTQDYSGRDTEERLAVNQVLAQARTEANPVTQQRAQTALDSTDPLALRTFLESGQYAAIAVDERVKVNQILADPNSTPEVKVAAQIALDAPDASVHNYLTVGRYTAAQHDDDNIRHESAVLAMLSQGYQISSLATKNAGLAQQAAALARKASAEAAQAKKDADAAADRAAGYATAAQNSANKADAAADRAAASAKKAQAAAKSANASANQAAGSARRADVSAAIAVADAREAYDAYDRAYSSAVAAGKDATSAAATAKAAINEVKDRIKKAQQGAIARNIYRNLDACLDLPPGFDPDACADRLYETQTQPKRTAAKNAILCDQLFDARSPQWQSCLNDVLSPTFQFNQFLDALAPYVMELGSVLDFSMKFVGLIAIAYVAPALFTICAQFCGIALELATPWLAPELIGVDLAIGGGVTGSVGGGGALTYGLVSLRGVLERIGVKSAAGSAETSRAVNAFVKCATGTNSFPPSTPVLLGDGRTTKPIADIQVGDEVLSTEPSTGVTGPEPVTALHTRTALKKLVSVAVAGDATHTGGVVTATANHPFWTTRPQEWQSAGELRTGDTLRTGPGSWTQIDWVAKRVARATVHNLTVAERHTFYVLAGDTPILVHNANLNCDGLIANYAPVDNLNDLSTLAFIVRERNGIRYGQNVVVVHVKGSKVPVFGVSAGSGYHSEDDAVHKLLAKGIDPGDITALFSDRAPCSACDSLLKKVLTPGTPITYAVPWGDDPVLKGAMNALLKSKIEAARTRGINLKYWPED